MSVVRLTARAAPEGPLEGASIRPDAFATLTEAEIASLPIEQGREAGCLGDFFSVQGGGSDDVRVLGDVSRVRRLGEGMASGRLRVEGPAGPETGARMCGGTLIIEGDAGAWAGAEMRGGTLDVGGNAGDHLASAYAGSPRGMTGGVVLVRGSVGDDAAIAMRRGLVAVAGAAGRRAAAHMIAGTLLVCGDLGSGAALGMKRGTLVAGGALELLPTFRYACTYRPGFLALLFRSLESLGFSLPPHFASGAFRRYGGDFVELGRGEILQWTS